jgi:steroid 5-alpha reductase family enzyme
MEIPANILCGNAALVAGAMFVLWLASLAVRDVSFIDAFWGFGFVLIAWFTGHLAAPTPDRAWLLRLLVTIWGLRLAIHLFRRWRSHGPDKRYTELIAGARLPQPLYTLLYIFLLQGVLMWIVALPVQLGQHGADSIGALAFVGAALAIFGIVFESVGDWQLARFKADASSRGKVLDTGLWRYTRHPNYFGDCCFWWGIWLVAVEAPGGWMSLPGPILMTFLLAKWSGVGPLEKNLRQSRPGYADYVRRTSAFVPLPRRAR